MVITDTPEKTKKRKKDGLDCTATNCTREGNVSTTEDSPSKIAKLVDKLDCSNDGASSESSLSSESDDDSQEMTNNSLKDSDCSNDGASCESSLSSESDDDSQEMTNNSLKDSVSIDQHGKRNLASFFNTSFPAVNSLKEEQEVLNLDQNQVFIKLLNVFSQEKSPEKITYNGYKYNLTEAYDEFWRTFYNLPKYSKGHEIKIPCLGLTDQELKAVVGILKRGWEDERYWPNKLASPFLASCLFGELHTNSTLITPKMFLKFIEPSEKALIRNQNNNVDQTVLDIFKKYCSKSRISIGDDITDSCRKAAYELMVINMKPIINIWSKELFGLIPTCTFDFLMSRVPGYLVHGLYKPKEDDMEGYTAPHKLWNTFFLDWPKEKVKYYFRMLANTIFDSECNLCGDPWFNAKHFLCKCDDFLSTLFLDRHDAILKKLLVQLDLALKRRGPYFSKGSNWNILTSFRNVHYEWPEEMSILKRMYPQKYPHIIVYSMHPKKRALIIEYSISWEYWMDVQKERKTQHYMLVKELLEKIEFEVEYRVFVLGSRGVLVPDLYDLFEQIFGMKHSEISKALEGISVETLSVPYQSDYYKEVMEILK